MKGALLMTDHLNIFSVCKDTELSNVLSYNQTITTALNTLVYLGLHFMCHFSSTLFWKEISMINQHEYIYKFNKTERLENLGISLVFQSYSTKRFLPVIVEGI